MTTTDLTPVLRDAADYITAHGWTQGKEQDAQGRVCLTGAIRKCAPQPGDFYIVRAVLRARGHDEKWNDAPRRKAETVIRYLRTAEVTDADLAVTFGPEWQAIVALIRRASVVSSDELSKLYAAWDAEWSAAWVAARVAARGAARGAAWEAAWVAAWAAAWDAAGYAAWEGAWEAAGDAAWEGASAAAGALSVRDLIGRHGFTADHYRTLTGPWRAVIGPAHPDDIKDGLA